MPRFFLKTLSPLRCCHCCAVLLLCVLCSVVQHARDGAGQAVQDAAHALHASLQPRGRQPLSTAAATAASSRASGAACLACGCLWPLSCCCRCVWCWVVWDRMSWHSLVSHSFGGMGTLQSQQQGHMGAALLMATACTGACCGGGVNCWAVHSDVARVADVLVG